MGGFKVVTNIAEIARLNRELGNRLSESFKVRRTREITYPSGHHTGTVYFESAAGASVRAWSHYRDADKLVNFLLSGDPTASAWMQIAVQINFPARTYNRRMAGMFVTDENGDVLVAHRGKLTKGKAGLRKAKVFREFPSQTVEAEDQGIRYKVILISPLNDQKLADRLWKFALDARDAATRISLEDDSREETDATSQDGRRGAKKSFSQPKDPLLKLRDYFDEYSGQGILKGHGGGRRTVEHGDIVKALELHLRAKGRSQKAQAIDLAIVATHVHLFEVKTSALTTDVYTGVGQLLIHGECIKELLEMPVRRHLVLPAAPRASYAKHVTKKGGINIVTYDKAGSSYRFNGLSENY